jgi:hypothetical protein
MLVQRMPLAVFRAARGSDDVSEMAERILGPLAFGSLPAGDMRRRDDPRHRRPAGGLIFLAVTGILGLAAAGSLFAACFSLLTRATPPIRPAISIATPIRTGSLPGLTNPPAGAAPPAAAVVERSALKPPAPAEIERRALVPPVKEQSAPALSAPPPRRAAASLPPATATLSAGDIAQAMERGEAALRNGDLAVARFYFQQAADAGDGAAAMRTGETFDPAFSGRTGRRGDVRAARFWYQRALDLGVMEAVLRLARLDPERRRQR